MVVGPRMSKEERRQLFEAQVKAEDELNAERQRQQEALLQQQQVAAAFLYQQDPTFAAMHGLTADPNLLAAQGQGPCDGAEKSPLWPPLNINKRKKYL